MSATLLDTTAPGWEIVRYENAQGVGFRHVNHTLRLATMGWMTREAAERNANLYRGDPGALATLGARYETTYG